MISDKNIVPTLILIALAGLVGLLMLPFFSAIALAGVFALAVHPYRVKFFKRKLKVGKTLSVYFIMGILLLVQVPFVLSFLKMFSQIKDFLSAESSEEKFRELLGKFYQLIDQLPFLNGVALESYFNGFFKKNVDRVIEIVLDLSSQLLGAMPSIAIFFFFFSCCFFYFLLDFGRIEDFIKNLSIVEVTYFKELVTSLQKISQSVIFSAIATGFAQAMIMALSAVVVPLDYVFVIFFLTFFFAQIPIVGITPVVVSLSLFLYSQQDIAGSVFVMALGLVAGITDNLVRVFSLNSTDKLHPLLGLIATIGGIFIFGPVGVILGPILILLLLNQVYLFNPK